MMMDSTFVRLMLGVFVVMLVCVSRASAQENVVRNPSFETDANRDGIPDEWVVAGDPATLTQELKLDAGRDGKRCALLVCSKYVGGNSSSHAMLAQMGVPVTSGKLYRVTLWARAEDLMAGGVSIALSNTKPWGACGLSGSFNPTHDWQRFEFMFKATQTVGENSRFQMWFASTGKLWVDDVEFTQVEGSPYKPAVILASAGHVNQVPNAGFECGTDGWGSDTTSSMGHWGGGLNRLLGEIDPKDAWEGQCSLRIDLSHETKPISYFDWFDLYHTEVTIPLAGHEGFVEFETGQPYTLSFYAKAKGEQTQGMMAVKGFSYRTLAQKNLNLTPEWQRYTLTFTPEEKWGFALMGPDIRRLPKGQSMSLWIDGVQLEKGTTASDYRPREDVEFGLETDKSGNIFTWEEPVKVKLLVANPGDAKQVKVELKLKDFEDRTVESSTINEPVEGKGRLERTLEFKPSDRMRGFLRLEAKLTSGKVTSEKKMRLAAIPVFTGTDSRFGVNHAYSNAEMLELCQKAGLLWMRDWSLKWHDIEPEKGQSTYAETDIQIDRVLKQEGLKVLSMFPFPSSLWSSEGGPGNPKGNTTERMNVSRQRPKDLKDLEDFVARTTAHYKGRVPWYQFLNEPLYTHYALPTAYGYTGKTYAELTIAFAKGAKRGDPDCKLLAGIGGLGPTRFMGYFEEFFQGGGLAVIDAVDVHQYPATRTPEYFEDWVNDLNALMDKYGGRKPIWLTEFGYYADDDPTTVPNPHSGVVQPLRDENQQCAYYVRWVTVLTAAGVDKFFHHAGCADSLNRESIQGVFFEYGGTPVKIYAAQAVLSMLFPPERKFAGKMDLGPDVKGYVFTDKNASVAVIWAPMKKVTQKVNVTNDKVKIWNVMGSPQTARSFVPGEMPMYVIGEGMTAKELEAAVK